jgi:hypothetical protein
MPSETAVKHHDLRALISWKAPPGRSLISGKRAPFRETRVPNAFVLEKSILAHQTSAEDAGRIVQEAGVKTLVLSHFVPPDDPEITEAMWLEAAKRHFRGTVILGRDLLEV